MTVRNGIPNRVTLNSIITVAGQDEHISMKREIRSDSRHVNVDDGGKMQAIFSKGQDENQIQSPALHERNPLQSGQDTQRT